MPSHGLPSMERPRPTAHPRQLTPPGVTRLEPGDFVEATIELLVVPLSAAEYYGPNAALRKALCDMANSWQMVHREAVGNDRRVELTRGVLEQTYPDVRVRGDNGGAEFTLHGGLGYVPLTFTGLPSHRAGELRLDGKLIDQSVHGGDFWQTDYDPAAQTWSQTFTVASDGALPADGRPMKVIFQQKAYP